MKIEWDFSEFEDFAGKLANLSQFERDMRFAAKEIASVLLKKIKALTPIGDTYQLMSGWNGNNLAVKKVGNGFEVLLVNTDEKALWVNDGHQVRNKADGPFLTVKNRVKVKSPYKWQTDSGIYYVFGHFFVERGILQLTDSQQLEEIIFRKLQQWWDSI